MEIQKFNSKENYSSLFLCEQINLFRVKEGKKKVIHADLLKKIRKEFDEEIAEGNISDGVYTDINKQKRPIFNLDYEQSLQLLMSESKTVRKGVIEVIKKLQKEVKKQLPQTYSQALRELAETVEKKELAEAKVQSLEEALDTSEQWISIVRAAKEYNVKETFFNWRKLKEYSVDKGIEVKKAPCPRYGIKNLYHVSVFKNVYSHLLN